MTAPWKPGLAAKRVSMTSGPAYPAAVVFAVTCDHFDVSGAQLFPRRATGKALDARAFMVWMLRSFGPTRTYQEIGRLLGTDHSNVMHLHQRAIRLRLTDARFASLCQGVMADWADNRETLQ